MAFAIPAASGTKAPEALLFPASIHVVTHESQLPPEFLHPSPEKQFVLIVRVLDSVDMELSLAFPDAIYPIDAIQGGNILVEASDLIAEGNVPEEEILSVLNIPSESMGYVIGRKGSSIMSIKESCEAEIVIGGAKGPPDKLERALGFLYLDKRIFRLKEPVTRPHSI